jgi:hypothetical protein
MAPPCLWPSLRQIFLLLDAPFEHPPGNARLLLQVDQSERRWLGYLPAKRHLGRGKPSNHPNTKITSKSAITTCWRMCAIYTRSNLSRQLKVKKNL